MATAKKAVNRSHSKLRLVERGVQFVANVLLVVFFRPVELLRGVHVQARASFFFLGIIIPLNSPRMSAQTSISLLSVSESHLALDFLPLVAIADFFACADPKTPTTTVDVNVAVAAIVTSTFTSREGHVHVRVMKRVV